MLLKCCHFREVTRAHAAHSSEDVGDDQTATFRVLAVRVRRKGLYASKTFLIKSDAQRRANGQEDRL
jgi:hypothetical protein